MGKAYSVQNFWNFSNERKKKKLFLLYTVSDKTDFGKLSYVNPISLSEYFSGSIKIFYTMYKE